jgi:hypothetical protein
MTRYAVAILLALTLSASAAERADKILSGCKIMLGILTNKESPAGTGPMGGPNATFCLGVVQEFAGRLSVNGSAFSRSRYGYV